MPDQQHEVDNAGCRRTTAETRTLPYGYHYSHNNHNSRG